MKNSKSAVYQHEQGSAERVVAHAVWKRSRGKNPSMSFIGERNPRKALLLAHSVIDRANHTDTLNRLGARIAQSKDFDSMTDVEIKIAVRSIVASSSSEEEIERRLIDELNYHDVIDLCIDIPTDEVGKQARELVRGLGGLVMKNGAMVMGMMRGNDGVICL